MPAAPLFSVIIPTYNSEDFVRTALESILQQSFRDFEILIIDGLSSDQTVKRVRDLNDGRIRILCEKDNGIYDAMNKGIREARGEWLFFLGSDDQLFSDSVLEEVSRNLVNQNVVYGNVKICGDNSWARDGQIYDGPFDLDKLFNKNICHQSVFYRASFIDKAAISFNVKYKLCADWDFNLKCRSMTGFFYLDRVIANFNSGGETTLSGTDDEFSRDMLSNLMTYFKISSFHPLLANGNFFRYQEVLSRQKKSNPLRYMLRKLSGHLN